MSRKVLKALHASLKDVVRTRIFTIDITSFEAVAKAHAEFSNGIKPATGFYEISEFVGPEYLVEIEFTAVLLEITK